MEYVGYYDSAEGVMISLKRAWAEFRRRHADHEDWDQFLADVAASPTTERDASGEIARVDAQAVLAWLGY